MNPIIASKSAIRPNRNARIFAIRRLWRVFSTVASTASRPARRSEYRGTEMTRGSACFQTEPHYTHAYVDIQRHCSNPR
jgi:hypothetical protein